MLQQQRRACPRRACSVKEALPAEAALKTMNVGKTQALQLKAAQEAVEHFAAFLKGLPVLRSFLSQNRDGYTVSVWMCLIMRKCRRVAVRKSCHMSLPPLRGPDHGTGFGFPACCGRPQLLPTQGVIGIKRRPIAVWATRA